MERSTLLRENLVAIAIGCQHSAICEDADTAIAPALRFPLRAETTIGSRLEILRRNRSMNSSEVWFLGHIREGANQTARAFPDSTTCF